MNAPKLRFKEFNETYRTYELNKLVTVTDCQHNTAPVSSHPTEYKMIRTGNVRDGKLIISTMDSVNEETYHKWSIRGYLKENDIILTREAPMGEVAIIPKNSKEKFFLGQRCLQLKTNLDVADPFYIYLLLQSKTFEKHIRPIKSSGSTVSNIRIPELKTFEFKVPSREEQIKVAAFIKNLNEKIQLHQEKIDLLKEQKKGYMQKIFSQELRFKDENGQEYPRWDTVQLKTVASVYDGTHQTPNYQNEGIKFLSVENIKNLETKKFISKADYIKEFIIRPEYNDILMTRIGDIGTANIISDNDDYAYYVSLALIKCKSINPKYLVQEISTDQFQKELHRRTLHVAFPKKINKGEIGECLINLPSTLEQEKIADFFSKFDIKIKHELKNLEALNSQKQAFMQQMFI